MSDIGGHFCGQTQPHPAHVWQTPQGYHEITLNQLFQCGGYSPAPWISDPEAAGA